MLLQPRQEDRIDDTLLDTYFLTQFLTPLLTTLQGAFLAAISQPRQEDRMTIARRTFAEMFLHQGTISPHAGSVSGGAVAAEAGAPHR